MARVGQQEEASGLYRRPRHQGHPGVQAETDAAAHLAEEQVAHGHGEGEGGEDQQLRVVGRDDVGQGGVQEALQGAQGLQVGRGGGAGGQRGLQALLWRRKR